jgi:hypothetical protein
MTDQEDSLPETYFLMCSGCRTPTPNTEAHVIPHWNETAESIFTSYRCNNCWIAAIDETREAVKSDNPLVISTFCDFLSGQGFTTDAENLRKAPIEQTRATLLALLDATEDGRAVFHP